MKNFFTLLFFSLFVVFSANAQKVKKVTERHSGKVNSKEEYFVIKRGKHKGKRHGLYTLSNFDIDISGNYHLGERDGIWFFYSEGVKRFYTLGRFDSTRLIQKDVENFYMS
ncbi:MAG: hypothetical protein ACPGYY_10240, partial [Bacteroidia bacterium]